MCGAVSIMRRFKRLSHIIASPSCFLHCLSCTCMNGFRPSPYFHGLLADKERYWMQYDRELIWRWGRNDQFRAEYIHCAYCPTTLSSSPTKYDFIIFVYFEELDIYKRTNVMQLGNKLICNCNIALHVSDAFCVHLQEHLEIVEAASDEWHETGWGIQQGVQGRWHPH